MLKEHFSSYGKVAEHQIMVDHSTGRSRGFGFVTFESEDSIERVMSDGRMHDLGGKQVTSFLLLSMGINIFLLLQLLDLVALLLMLLSNFQPCQSSSRPVFFCIEIV